MTQTLPVNSNQSVEQAFEYILQNDLARVKQWEPVALKGKDIEGVHQMRVSLRRMRSALTVFRKAIPRKATASMSKEMRWAAHMLDHARDIDVYIDESLSSMGNKKHRGEKKMIRIAKKDRENTYGKVKAFIRGKRYSTLKKHLDHWVAQREWRDRIPKKERKTLDAKITPFASNVLEFHRNQVVTTGHDIQNLDSDALHQLRIDCKKLRYATEFFSPIYGKSMVPFTQQLKQLQDLLGTLHDRAIMEDLQQGLLTSRNSAKVKRFAGKLQHKRLKEAKTIMKQLKKNWHAFIQAKRPWKAKVAA